MTRVLVVTAVEMEARSLAEHLALTRVAGVPWPLYRGGKLEVACVGLRAARLDERADACATPELVVSAGACGGLAPELATGDLVVPEVVIAADGARHPTDALAPLSRAGTLLTVPDAIATPEAKARLWIETGARAVDMESAVILAWARARSLSAAVVRGVSDTARQGVPPDLAALVEPGGRIRTAGALRAALSRPRALADAIALGRGTAVALRSVAAALARVIRP